MKLFYSGFQKGNGHHRQNEDQLLRFSEEEWSSSPK